jgi:hypothetical protein
VVEFPRGKKKYVGGAHGIFGELQMIVQAMLQVPELHGDKNLLEIVGNTFKFMIELQASNGSFPTKLEESTVELKKFQWCHGAPGAIPPFLAAAKLFQDVDPELKSQCI